MKRVARFFLTLGIWVWGGAYLLLTVLSVGVGIVALALSLIRDEIQ